jgi:hypothetical protein
MQDANNIIKYNEVQHCYHEQWGSEPERQPLTHIT